jgi:hypothetical protein
VAAERADTMKVQIIVGDCRHRLPTCRRRGEAENRGKAMDTAETALKMILARAESGALDPQAIRGLCLDGLSDERPHVADPSWGRNCGECGAYNVGDTLYCSGCGAEFPYRLGGAPPVPPTGQPALMQGSHCRGCRDVR